jgi:hypothetical protein
MTSMRMLLTGIAAAGTVLLTATAGFSHGDVQPQAVDTSSLEQLGDEWLEENPYRLAGRRGLREGRSRSAHPATTRTAPAAMAWRRSRAVSHRTCAIWKPTPSATNGTWSASARATPRTAPTRCRPSRTSSARKRCGRSDPMWRRDRKADSPCCPTVTLGGRCDGNAAPRRCWPCRLSWSSRRCRQRLRPLDDVIESGRITIFVYDDYAPYSWRDDSGEMVGIDVGSRKGARGLSRPRARPPGPRRRRDGR